MKNITAIFLLTVFFFSSNGHWIVNQVNYFQMKERVEKMKKEQLSESDIQQLSFSKEQFSGLVFHDEGNELEFEGKMYDIVTIKKYSGKIIINCLTDAKETELKLLAKKQQEQKNLRLKNILEKNFFPSRDIMVRPPNHSAFTFYLSIRSCGEICSISYEILKPPPQIV